MHWLYLLLALTALTVAFKTTSVAVLAIALLAAFGLLLAFVLVLLAQRVGTQTRDESMMLDPAELRRLREQAEARKLAATAGSAATPPADNSAR